MITTAELLGQWRQVRAVLCQQLVAIENGTVSGGFPTATGAATAHHIETMIRELDLLIGQYEELLRSRVA